VTHETGDVRQVIERLEGLAVFAEQDERAYRRAEATLVRQAAELLKSSVSQPAPSGWQQLRAAFYAGMKWPCGWCEPFDQESADRGFAHFVSSIVPPAPRQNAVDALPPAPEVKDANPPNVEDAIPPAPRQHSNTCDLVGFRQGYNAPGVCSCGADAKDAIPPGPEPGASPGIGLITEERRRVQAEKGCDAAHDDGHGDFELSKAAVAYLRHAQGYTDAGDYYPHEACEFHPSAGEPVRDLVKAGQLVAAEIDRLLRLQAPRPLIGSMTVIQGTTPRSDGLCACGRFVVSPHNNLEAAGELHTAHTCRLDHDRGTR
jgi:hypothetical protein